MAEKCDETISKPFSRNTFGIHFRFDYKNEHPEDVEVDQDKQNQKCLQHLGYNKYLYILRRKQYSQEELTLQFSANERYLKESVLKNEYFKIHFYKDPADQGADSDDDWRRSKRKQNKLAEEDLEISHIIKAAAGQDQLEQMTQD